MSTRKGGQDEEGQGDSVRCLLDDWPPDAFDDGDLLGECGCPRCAFMVAAWVAVSEQLAREAGEAYARHRRAARARDRRRDSL